MIEFIDKIPDSLFQVLTETASKDSAVFKMLQSGVKVTLDSGELQYGQNDDQGLEVQEKLFERVLTDINDKCGTVYLTSE